MPPLVVPTGTITGQAVNAQSVAVAGALVVAKLNAGPSVPQSIAPAGQIVPIEVTTTTAPDGSWSLSLVPNNNINPTNTTYTISVPGHPDVFIQLNDTASHPYLSIAVSPTGATIPAATTTIGALTVSGALTVAGDIIAQARLVFNALISKIVPGATSLSLRNNADTADNVLITDVGDVTIRNRLLLAAAISKIVPGATELTIRDTADAVDNLIVFNGGVIKINTSDLQLVARLVLLAAASKIVPGATSLSLRNNADTADNLIATDAGLVTLRNALSIPPSAAGVVAPTSYGTVPVKIGENVLGVATASVTFSAIPQVFRHLELIATARGDTAAVFQVCGLRFNGDAAANYFDERMGASGTVAISGQESVAVTQITDFFVSAATSTANFPGMARIFIPDYRGTTFIKTAFIAWGMINGVTTGNFHDDVNTGYWNNTAAITSITIFPVAGNFIAGSTFTLYGIP